jgi:RHS repeat-associated protein
MNGVNYPQFDTTIEEYDQLGRLAGVVDGAGVRTEYTYDVQTSARKTMTQDAGSVSSNLNLVTDYEVDDLGRPTAELGPKHFAGQNGTSIRSTTRTRYLDEDNTVWTWQGYQTVETVPADVVINPVSITVLDHDDHVLDEISSRQGTEREYVGAPDQSISDRANWLRWTRRVIQTSPYTARLAATRVYHDIPDSGEGQSGANYNETQYQYDNMGRQNYVRTPGGTITTRTYDPRDLVTDEKMGTDETSLLVVRVNVYDQDAYSDESDSKDGLLVGVGEPVDGTGTNNRITKYRYDCRNRRTTVLRDDDTLRNETAYDNLDRPTVQSSYHTSGNNGETLLSLIENHYDTRGRLYRTDRHGIDDAGNETGVVIEDNRWYDARDSVIKSSVDGMGEFTKYSYDALGRQKVIYYAYYTGPGMDQVTSVSNDIVLEQTVYRHDDGLNPSVVGWDTGNVTFVTTYRRAPVDMITRGALDKFDEPAAPSRILYTGLWYDEIGRPIARGRFGTHGGTRPDRDLAPSSSSTATQLVTRRAYGQDGELQFQMDEKQQVTQTTYDTAGRVESVTRNEFAGEYERVSMTYNADGNVETLQARNAVTGTQTTEYVYGVNTDPPDDTNNEAGGSEINSSLLLFKVIYPEQDAASEHLRYRYNRQGQPIVMIDQNGTQHGYQYDKLGRLTEDNVTVGAGVDGTVQRIGRAYDKRQRLWKVTSWDASDTTPLNEVEYRYNAFDQVSKESQSHAGAAEASSPAVSYVHDSDDLVGSTLLREEVIYPNSKVLSYQYDTYDLAGTERKMSRPSGLEWDGQDVASYSYLGRSSLTAANHLTSNGSALYRLVDDAGIGDGEALDRFDRVERSAWSVTRPDPTKADVTTVEVDLHYGYDYASNRMYRRDERARSDNVEQDEKYSYDGLHRLTDFQRGALSADNSAIVNANLEQDWDLDETGNWTAFNQRIQTPLAQTRTHKLDNQIDTIDTWDDPAHDGNGNMTLMPRASDPTKTFRAVYDAWNRLVRVEDGSSGELVAAYEYDGLGRRIVKRTTETLHYYYSDQWQVVEEQVEPSERSVDAASYYVWGLRYIDDLIIYERVATGQRLFGLQDANWNVVALLDDTGLVQERYSYEPYGKVEFQDADFVARPAGSAFENSLLFTGQRLDTETGLFQYRNRYYDPQLGRFINRDPIGYGDGMNLYGAYFVPNGVDPSGLADGMPVWARPTVPPRYPPQKPLRTAWNALLDGAMGQHGSYLYAQEIGMQKFIDGLKGDIVPHMYFDQATSEKYVAQYFWLDNAVLHSPASIGAVSPITALHETVHAFDDFNGVTYMAYYQENSEVLAYGAEAIFLGTKWMLLRDFENGLSNMRCDEAKKQWKRMWDGNPASLPFNLLNASISWTFLGFDMPPRNLTNEDYKFIANTFGLRISCSALAAMYSKKIEGGCCKLVCPRNVPSAFR